MIAAVVLAAGASSRFGSPPKQTLLLPRVLARVRAAPSVEDVVVVAGAHSLDTDARVVPCSEWERGPGASLRCGVGALAPQADAAIVVLADGPNLDPKAIERVVRVWRRDGDELLAAAYAGERGHPVLVARSLWGGIPDEGLRAFDPRLVPCDDLEWPGDVNRPGDLENAGT